MSGDRQPTTIAVDLGNSAAKWSVNGHAEQRVSLRSSNWSELLIEGAFAACGGTKASWRIASVNRPVAKLLVGRLADECRDCVVRTIDRDDVPMVAKVSNPDRVGIDRILAAWMASQTFPGQALIVVDAGSAITVDMVSPAAEFLGGVIVPGLALQFDSLARGTDALPAIELPEASEITPASLPIPATDTISAIRSGILLGTASAVDGLIDHHISRARSDRPAIVFTGGDSALLSKLSRHHPQTMPRLVLDAIHALPLESR